MTAKLAGLLPAPAVPRVVYVRPPLKLVVCQVRFSTLYAVASPEFLAPFQQALQERYPIARPTPILQVQVVVGSGQTGVQQGAPSQAIHFTDFAGDWTVALTTEFVTLETRSYADFQDFLDRLREVLDALVNIFRPTIGTRVGLRYVNELRPGHEDWSRVVRPELLGPLAVPEVGALVVHAVQQFQLRDPDGLAVQLAHGLVPGGSSVQPKLGEEPAQTPFYLLDMDVFQEFPHPGSLLMDPAAICTRVATFHEVVSRLFRWAITPEFAATLGVRDDVA